MTRITSISALVGMLAFGAAKLPAQDCEAHQTQILAGQNMHAADVVVSNTLTDLIIQIDTVDGWLLREVHIFAGQSPLPLGGGGNPSPGQFPFATDYPSPGVAQHTEIIPLADLGADCGDTLNIAIHTVVENTDVNGREGCTTSETGWAFGDKEWPGNRWGWYFCYDVCCEPSVGCENLTLSGPDPCLAGVPNTLSAINAVPGNQVGFFYGFNPGSVTGDIHDCLGVTIGILDPRTLGKIVANGAGSADRTIFVPNAALGRTVYFQCLDNGDCCVSNVVSCTFQ